MLSETLVEGLKPYAIGEKLRALRLKKKMGLVELGSHTGLSPALLSKIERGKLIPTLPTLLRISMVFNVGLEYFFTDKTKNPVLIIVRKKDRIRFPAKAGSTKPSYFFESLDFPALERKLNAYYAEFQPVEAGETREHQHPGVEFVFVVSGTLLLTAAGQEHRLAEGDSVYFDSTAPHSYRREGRKACSAVVVTAD